MKNIWKKNQIIITALVIMVGVAGYLNFTDETISETLNWEEMVETSTTTATKEPDAEEKENVADVEEGILEEEKDKSKENKKDEKENVGEAVLTSTNASDLLYSAKLAREQTRAENKEMLTEIINNANATEEQKNAAIDSIMEMADFAEKENAAETLLSAKGFKDSVVSMEADNVDVVVSQTALTDQEITQIEDIVKRKTGVSMDKIVISTANE